MTGRKSPMNAEAFRDLTVVITGASSGIGKATALALAGEGAQLALAARNVSRLDELVLECEQRGGKAIAVQTDVADESQCKRLIDRTRQTFDHIDMLVNNAGMSVVSKFQDLPDLHLFKQVMAVNLSGAIYCTYYALPQLIAARGRIVNISSLGGLMALPYNSSYNASKFALMGFSDALRMELESTGVSVTVICPSWVVTEFHERYLDKDGIPKGPAGRKIYTKNTMTAEQCARIVIRAARRRQRQVVMRPGAFGLWLKLLAPSWLDRMTISLFLRPAVKRISERAANETH